MERGRSAGLLRDLSAANIAAGAYFHRSRPAYRTDSYYGYERMYTP